MPACVFRDALAFTVTCSITFRLHSPANRGFVREKVLRYDHPIVVKPCEAQ